jgi:hypothetical protein
MGIRKALRRCQPGARRSSWRLSPGFPPLLATPTMQAVQGSWMGLFTRRAVGCGFFCVEQVWQDFPQYKDDNVQSCAWGCVCLLLQYRCAVPVTKLFAWDVCVLLLTWDVCLLLQYLLQSCSGVCVFYYCRTYYKAVRGVGGGIHV